MPIRPSKTFQFEIIRNTLKTLDGEIGFDAAAESMKNRKMFRTKKYYGLDIDVAMLKKGLAQNASDPAVIALVADLAHLEKIQSGSVDVCVSSNTLYHLPLENRYKAINELCRIMSPSGTLLLDLPLAARDGKIELILKECFGSVKQMYFRNIISQIYEGIFSRNGNLGTHPLAGTKPFLALSWLLSRLEYTTYSFKTLNAQTLYVCKNKRDAARNVLDLAGIPLLEDRMYNLR